ncbi:flagellar hook-length control protein FliK [Enterobacter sp. BIGb0383]|uniref:flagellar hook length control protein FliK n=1 Tax=unclassified Enterobacter TaxID=2608935 RepID=UPI000F49A87E|nr:MULTISPECIES: flagellar hook length control protein FliK [unclassified Enterobacter]ROP62560.1 flagellar hook-length control protein FliK [Enterobacter sp. BIGb0383]ROS12721.1 flagellar hook-length control protein FliK [Enterobacter sp. BIGb0359]
MISLPKIVASDADTSIFGQSAKGGDGAQDFLALLAGALGDGAMQGDKALSLADLQAAGARLQKGLPDLAAGKDAKLALNAKLNELLAHQDTLADDSLAQLTAGQSLLTGLTTTPLKTDALSALSKSAQRGSDLTADVDSSLSEEELAGLSALLAMLPHQQTATTTPTTAAAAGGTASLASAAAASAKGALSTDAAALAAGKGKDSNAAAKGNDMTTFAQQLAAAPVNATKVEVDTTPTPTAPTIIAAPSAASHITAAAPSGIAAPLINAPLGSPDWQQSVSQHITMFTRQGQQTAELRLHPEDLGQIQITLKLDDNQAQLQMISAHSHVRAALEAALPVLRTHLAESGIQLGQSSISSESFAGQQQSSSQQQQQAQRSGTSGTGNFGAEEDEPLNVPASLQSVARGNGAVDIFA